MTRAHFARRLAFATLPFIAGAFSVGALAQDALFGSDLVLPADAPSNADMVILKTQDGGGFDKFKIIITNTGSVAVTGAIVTDKAGNGGICSKDNAVMITGDGIPAGTFKISDLDGAGITLGTLNSGQSATISYSCQGK